jgi:flagellar hook-basal body complex protein FliE
MRASMAAPAPPPTAEFGDMLNALATTAVGAIRAGEEAAAAGITGAMPVQDVVEKVLAAERALQTTIAIRDKMVGAWLEISRMQI